MLNHNRVVISLRKADAEAVFSRLEDTLAVLGELPLAEEAERHQRRMELVDGRSAAT
jgi:hypothetical protein